MRPSRNLRTHLLKNPFSRSFFSSRSSEETYSWNLEIACNLRRKNQGGAFSKYAEMRREGIQCDSHSLGFLVKSCSSLLELQQAHSQILKMGFSGEVINRTAILTYYAAFSELVYARKLFDESSLRDLPLWNAVISAYSRHGEHKETLHLSRTMVGDGLRPNAVTITSILSSCTTLKDCSNGKLIHGYILKNFHFHDTLLYSALLAFYGHSGAIAIARRLFDEMPSRDVIAWTAMIAAYSENSCPEEAFTLFKDMVAADFAADEVTILATADAAGKLQDPDVVEFIDAYAVRRGLLSDTRVANSLILAHGRCGNIRRACELFDGMSQRTAVSWTCMIQALAINGRGQEALLRFSQMLISGVVPDELCYLSVLSGCNRCGMVDEARKCFKAMVEEHGLSRWMEHYSSMIDLLCRDGLFEEALGFLGTMPMKPDERLMKVFINWCERKRRHSMAVKAVEELLGRDEGNGPAFSVEVNA